MKRDALRRAWHFWLGEPFWWLFLAFFQPRRLEREFMERYPYRWQRVGRLLQLIISMILLNISILLLAYPILFWLHLAVPTISNSLLDVALGMAIDIALGLILGLVRDIVLGIMLSAAILDVVWGMVLGMIDAQLLAAPYIIALIALLLILSIILSIKVIRMGRIGMYVNRLIEKSENNKERMIMNRERLEKIQVYIEELDINEKGRLKMIELNIKRILVDMKDLDKDVDDVNKGKKRIERELKLLEKGGYYVAKNMIYVIAGVVSGITLYEILGPYLEKILSGVLSIPNDIAFNVAYVIAFFRLPIAIVNIPSAICLYRASCQQPARVFEYLHRSTLYWDELVYLPLPFLKQTLLLAYEESPERALEEIAFIVAERPRQIRVARTAALEIALRDLEACKDLVTIAEAADRLAEILPAASKLTKEQSWTNSIAKISDASRDAARAISPIGLQGRRKALEDLQANLQKVHPKVAFRDQRLNVRLGRVVETWHAVAQQELERLKQAAQDLGSLDNPYKPGEVLSLKDTLFQGRHDLAKELEEALSSNRHPTFLLNGERRMGKTSILQQLPYLLGSAHISVFYNLQQPGLYASPTTFLDVLASGIQRALEARVMPIKPLTINTSREAVNHARLYQTFEQWLAEVEVVLEREERTLLLAFDEFEMLEEAEQARYMEVRPLLNWMRSVIQFHPRIAFLFSGVKTFDEMGTHGGIDWTGYFVNVQVLRVSFLKPAEARNLILKPTDGYPGAEIFPPAVVEQILTDTGCHPFLLQAVCSTLITLLNVEHREVATLEDVAQAGTRVLSEWGHHFTHLWNRSSSRQRACMEALLERPQADVAWIAQQAGLEVKVARRSMRHLLRRDLVASTPAGMYGLAVPLFRRWLEER